ncbi:MAG: hypothetical protein WDN04_09605 [Rhodospirillales bacterium]
MQFQIHALPAHTFATFFGGTDSDLAERGIIRVTADKSPGFPCRAACATRRLAKACCC